MRPIIRPRAALLRGVALLAALSVVDPSWSQIGPPPGHGGGGGTPGGSNGQVQYNNAGSFGGLSRSGPGTTIGTTAGSLTTGHCVSIDASGNLVDSGGACSGGVSSITTTCPAGGPLTGAVTVSTAITPNAQTGTTYTISASDCGKLITLSNASSIAVTLPQAGTTGFGSGFFVASIQNLGAGTATITPTTSQINKAATLVLLAGQSAGIVSDGTNYFAQTGVSSPPGGTNGQIQYNNAGVLGGVATVGTGTSVVKATALSNSSGTTLATTTGSLASNDCVKIDANGNLVDSGAGCGGTPGGSSGQLQYNNSGSFGGYNRSGTGTTIASTTGSLTTGDCVKIDASGNLVDSGAGCGGTGSPGGSSGQIQFNNAGSFGGYPTSGNGTTVATASGTLTSGDCAKFDANGNVVDAGACTTPYWAAYVAGRYYPSFPYATIAATALATASRMECAPFRLTQAIHISEIDTYISTVGTTNSAMAIYSAGTAPDATTGIWQPEGAPLASSGALANTSTGVLSYTFTAIALPPGVYFFCTNSGDSSVKFYGPNLSVPQASAIMGASTASYALLAGSLFVGLYYASVTTGTWPTFSTGTTFTDENSSKVAAFTFKVSSVP